MVTGSKNPNPEKERGIVKKGRIAKRQRTDIKDMQPESDLIELFIIFVREKQ